MNVIVNADDLGANKEVNDATFALMAEGRVTSATLLPNAPAVIEAARQARTFPRRSFGVHLNLTEFRPVTSHPGLQRILDDDGCFAGNRIREIQIDWALREGILSEWSAQVDKLLTLSVPISHFDSHHHVHTVPALFPVLKALQRRFGIRKVRLTMNLYGPDAPTSRGLLCAKALWNFALRHWYRTTTTRHFTSFEEFLLMPKEDLRNWKCIELMVHPGNTRFSRETQLLRTDWLKELPSQARCISYNEL